MVDAREQTWPEPPPTLVPLLDVEAAVAKLKHLLQHHNRRPQLLGIRKWTVELDATTRRFAGELHAREVLIGRDLQVRKGLVVFQFLVVLRLNVLDQPRFEEQGVDLGMRLDEVEVGNLRDQIRCPSIDGCQRRKVAACAAAEVDRLADVDDSSLGILHEVHTGGIREGLNLLARGQGGRGGAFSHQWSVRVERCH